MASPKYIAILILAAGASSRMGLPKQLLPWEDTTLLGSAIRKAKASDASTVVVVLGANAASIKNGITEKNVEIVENPHWSSGLGSSIARGTDFLIQSKNKTNGILILLADQPLIDTAYLNEMMAAFASDQRQIVATAYGNRAGVPALFSEDYFKELTKLDDDFGAKKILDSHKKDALILNLGQKTVDIDTKSDYENLTKDLN